MSTENNLQSKDVINFYTQFDLFTTDECKKILDNVSNLRKTNFTIKLSRKFIRKGSSMKSQHLSLEDDTKWIFDRLTKKLSDIFNIEWISTPTCVFRYYTKGDYFLEHKDGVDSGNGHHTPRYFTVSTQLSDTSEYDGGDVIVDRKYVNNKAVGTASLWGSNLIHEVKEVNKGIRYSLVFFVSANHISFKNKSII